MLPPQAGQVYFRIDIFPFTGHLQKPLQVSGGSAGVSQHVFFQGSNQRLGGSGRRCGLPGVISNESGQAAFLCLHGSP